MIFRHLLLRQQPACILLKTTKDERKLFGKPSIFLSFFKNFLLLNEGFFFFFLKGDG